MFQNKTPKLKATFAVILSPGLSLCLSLYLSLGVFLMSIPAMAAGSSSSGSSGMMQRATAREAKRWTLQEWLSQKERNSLMDQWLVMNSPSPFEFMIGGSVLDYKTRTESTTQQSENSFRSSQGQLAAYAQAVGLSVDYENNGKENYNDLTGAINIRLLGNSLQATSLTLSAGQRTRTLSSQNPEVKLKNPLAEVSLQAYMTKYFGLQGLYRNYFSVTDSTLGDVSGTRSEAGLFIDFKSLRVFGSWFQDIQSENLNSATTETKRTGIKTGLQFYF